MPLKTGRNDPCPCGSGKKFKRCCADQILLGQPPLSVVAKSVAPPVADMNRLLFNAGRMPEDADAYNQLGVTLRRRGQLDEAVDACRRAVQIRPGYADGHNNLGNALRSLGRLVQAEASYRRALEINPHFAIAHSNLGNVLKDRGHTEQAVASFRSALRLDPGLAGAHSNLGAALRDLGYFAEAASCFRRALELDPTLAEAHVNLGLALRDLGQFDAALASYRRALELNPQSVAAHNNIGNIHSELSQYDAAVTAYRRALSIESGHADALGNLGALLMRLGEAAEAERCLGRAIECAPESARTLATALSHLPYRTDDPRFGHLESVYARRAALPIEDRIQLNFSVGKALEAVARYDASFAAYAEGNRLHHDLHPFAESAAAQGTQRLCETFTRPLLEACAGVSDDVSAHRDDPLPIFIVGMPRSGTTLIEQILASHPKVFGGGELSTLDPLAREALRLSFDEPHRDRTLARLRQLGREYLDQLQALAQGKAYVTDKMPENFQHLGLIQLMLPTAKILHAVRDPLDTCFSCYALRFAWGHEYSYDLAILGRHYRRYRTLMRHWHAVLPAGRILDVSYEDTVASPERAARRMLEHLGLDWDPTCLRFHESTRVVRTASFSQVRQPIYRSSVARHRHFAAHLAPLVAALRNVNADPP